jgi:hypothetical protein
MSMEIVDRGLSGRRVDELPGASRKLFAGAS